MRIARIFKPKTQNAKYLTLVYTVNQIKLLIYNVIQ